MEVTIAYTGVGVGSHAKSPTTGGLFETRDIAVPVEEVHSACRGETPAKREKIECLTVVAYLVTRLTKCTDDVVVVITS